VNTNVVAHHAALMVLTQEQHKIDLVQALCLDPKMQLLQSLIQEKPVCDMDKLSKALLCLFRTVPSRPVQMRLVMEAIDYEVDCMDTRRLDNCQHLFRTNSLSSKIVSNFLFCEGREFLIKILTKPMKEMWNQNLSCEINPSHLKLPSKELKKAQKENSNRLFQTAKHFLEAILKSSEAMPEWFRTLCQHLKWKMQV
jgi:hypothetical protein